MTDGPARVLVDSTGANIAKVKAASTAAVATDEALVVAVSPNNTVGITASSLPLPTGAATAALQTQPGVDIGDVTINNTGGAGAVNIQDGGNSITVDAVSLPLPTGAATEATLATRAADATITARLNTLGQKTMANSAPVVLSSDQSAIPVTGPLTDTQLRATPVPVSDGGGSLTVDGTVAVSNFPAVQPVNDNGGSLTVDNPNLDVALSTRASEATLATLLTEAEFEARVGEVQPTPTANTILGRLKNIWDELTTRLPAALVGGRLDSNIGSWLGSTAPTVGQKTAAASVPVTMASDQPPLQVNVTSSTKPHYYILFDRIVPATNKYMGTLFNPIGSGRLLEVKRVYVLNWQNAGNQSATLDEYMAFITARSGGSSVPIRKFDTTSADSLMESFTADTTVTESYIIRRFFAAINQVNLANANWFNALAFAVNGEIFSVKNDVVPLTFQPGEGMAIRNVTNNTSGSVSYIVEYAESNL